MANKERPMTIIFVPYGADDPYWAEKGHGYIARRYLYFREEGCPHDEPHRFELHEVIVLDGWRDDIIQAVEEYKRRYREWMEARERFIRDLDSRLADLRLMMIQGWEEQNPMPRFTLQKFTEQA